MLYTKSANLQKRVGKKLSLYEEQIERANTVKQIINEDDQYIKDIKERTHSKQMRIIKQKIG